MGLDVYNRFEEKTDSGPCSEDMGNERMDVVDMFDKRQPASVAQIEKTQRNIIYMPQADKAPDVRKPWFNSVCSDNSSCCQYKVYQ